MWMMGWGGLAEIGNWGVCLKGAFLVGVHIWLGGCWAGLNVRLRMVTS